MRPQTHIGPQTQANNPPNRERLVLLSIAIIYMLIIGQVITQKIASDFGYTRELGIPAIGHNIYWPWSFAVWMKSFGAHYPDVFQKACGYGFLMLVIGLVALMIYRFARQHSSRAYSNLHGSARWANENDVRAAGLLPPKHGILGRLTGKTSATPAVSVYVGGWLDKNANYRYLRHSGPEHILTYAPTRSGKGVGLVLPTLLSWTHSVFVTDLKGELWALTAGWRKQYGENRVLRFEPAAPNSLRWNPLDEIRLGTEYEVGDVQNLAQLIVDPDGKGMTGSGNSAHFMKTSFALLVGVILHALYKSKNGDGPPATLPLIDYMLADPDHPIADLFAEMKTYSHVYNRPHPAISTAAQDMIDRPEEEYGSVLSTAKSFLAIYRDPIVARSVGASEFHIADLMNHDNPVSLYIVTTPDDKTRLKPLVRLLIAMTLRRLTGKLTFKNGAPVASWKHRLLMMLDEFPSLGKIEILQESLAFLAGYGIKCYLICQDVNQLRSRETGYGPDETITSNCHIQNAFPPNRLETAEHLSRLTGQTTVVKEQITTSGRRFAAVLSQASHTYQEVQRPLLTPDECLRMPGAKKDADGKIIEAGDMVIYVAGYPAIYGKQPLYFKDPIFSARAALEAPPYSDKTAIPPPQAPHFKLAAEATR
jgi:type IV secretion system protein VirD4